MGSESVVDDEHEKRRGYIEMPTDAA